MSNDIRTFKRRDFVLFCLWPGLARLWFRGDFSALMTAAAFAMLLNMALVSTFLWTRWPGAGFPWIIWPIVVAVWTGSVLVTWSHLQQIVQLRESPGESDDTLLIRAQTEYLKGNWSEAQLLISRLLKAEPRHVSARLLLATLLRHTARYDNARQQLDILSRFDESVAWHFEISRERLQLQQFESDSESADESRDSDDQRDNLETHRVTTSVDLIDDDHPASPERRAA